MRRAGKRKEPVLVTVTVEPGRAVTFRARGFPDLKMERLPNGCIKQHDQKRREPTGNLWLEQDQVTISRPHPKGIRGRIHTLREQLLQPVIDTEKDRRASNFSIVQEVMQDDARNTFIKIDHGPAKTLEKLADLTAWERAKRLTGQRFPDSPDTVTLDQYNWAAAAGNMLDELAVTNPGAVAWLMNLCPKDPCEEINHPGQIIATVKEDMQRNGLPPNCWRTAATLPRDYIMATTMLGSRRTATRIIAAIAAAGTKPGLKTTDAMGYALATRYRDHADTPLGLRNQQRAAMLACRHDNGNDVLRTIDLSNAVDYAIAMSGQGIEVRSTTFPGLMKATERWHRQFRETNIDRMWRAIVEKNGGRYRAWNSLVGPTDANGITITPLTSEHQLLLESADMEHCVLSYGAKCAGGNSRIFNLMRKGEKTATGEIVLGPKGWTSTQVSGPRNAPPGKRETKAMRKVAKLYDTEWRRATAQKHHHVLIDNEC